MYHLSLVDYYSIQTSVNVLILVRTTAAQMQHLLILEAITVLL